MKKIIKTLVTFISKLWINYLRAIFLIFILHYCEVINFNITEDITDTNKNETVDNTKLKNNTEPLHKHKWIWISAYIIIALSILYYSNYVDLHNIIEQQQFNNLELSRLYIRENKISNVMYQDSLQLLTNRIALTGNINEINYITAKMESLLHKANKEVNSVQHILDKYV